MDRCWLTSRLHRSVLASVPYRTILLDCINDSFEVAFLKP